MRWLGCDRVGMPSVGGVLVGKYLCMGKSIGSDSCMDHRDRMEQSLAEVARVVSIL